MAGMLTAAEARQQVSEAHAKYMTGAYVPGAASGAYVDHLARVATANATHTAVTNAQLATNLNKVGAYDASGNLVGWVYAGGNVVTVAANRAGVDLSPEDAQNTEDLEFEVLVEDALAGDALHTTGGMIPHVSSYYNAAGTEAPYWTSNLSPYIDPMWLAEASKQTGEKLF